MTSVGKDDYSSHEYLQKIKECVHISLKYHLSTNHDLTSTIYINSIMLYSLMLSKNKLSENYLNIDYTVCDQTNSCTKRYIIS